MNEPFDTLIEAANRAPSGDNTQPWRFVIDPAERRLMISVDEARDPSPMNAGQRMSRIAVGAALENVLRSAESEGWSTELETPSSGDEVAVRLIESSATSKPIDPAIVARVTNRRRYDRRPLDQDVLEALKHKTPTLNGTQTHWIAERERIDRLASIIGRTDAWMFGQPSMREAFLENVRFNDAQDTAAWDTETRTGLPLASLELSAPQRMGLRLMRRIPDRLLKLSGAIRLTAAATRGLVGSASGLCVITTGDNGPATDVIVGRAMQRAWLALTAKHMAVQPMMSTAILESVLYHHASIKQPTLNLKANAYLIDEFHSVVPGTERRHLAFVMRFGFAPPPTGRTGRLQPSASTTTGAILPG